MPRHDAFVRDAAMHASVAVVATAAISIAVNSPALLFMAAFHIYRFALDVPMILRGLFEGSSATANSAAPRCHHARICSWPLLAVGLLGGALRVSPSR